MKKSHPFEGILPNLRRRYQETESNAVREELSRYISSQPCPDCGGTRLNQAARHVFIADHNLPVISRMPIGNARDFFAQLKLPGQRGKIADKILMEIDQRLHFLVNRNNFV